MADRSAGDGGQHLLVAVVLEFLNTGFARHLGLSRKQLRNVVVDDHPLVERVFYPGRSDHPQHAIARQQMRDFGGMITMTLKGGLAESRTFLESLKLFSLAESLGGVESLVEHPAIMTHASVDADARQALGITDGLVRLSVGIEDADDLLGDLDQALGAIRTGSRQDYPMAARS